MLAFGKEHAHQFAVDTASNRDGLQGRHRSQREDLHLDGFLPHGDDANGNGLVESAGTKTAAPFARSGCAAVPGPVAATGEREKEYADDPDAWPERRVRVCGWNGCIGTAHARDIGLRLHHAPVPLEVTGGNRVLTPS